MTGRSTGGPPRLGDDRLRRLRMRAQRLTGGRPREVAEVVRAVLGLQAQDTPASRLAVRPRSTGLDEAAVRRACNQDRSVVRTWAMRGTLHLVAAEDAGWLVGLLGPVFAAADRRRRLQLGLDDRLCERALEALPAVLATGPLSRADLVRGLAAEGVRVDPDGQAPAHLVAYAALRGLVCRGPDLDGDQASYVLLDDWGARRGGRASRTLDPDVPPWRIGIEHPHDPGRLIAVVPVTTGAVATSGTAHRGQHLVDARTGRPPSGVASVTVVAASLTIADIDATAAYARGEDAARWLGARPGRTGLVVWADGSATTVGGGTTAVPAGA